MQNAKFEKTMEKDIKLDKVKEVDNEMQEQIEFELKNTNNNGNTKDYKSKKEKFYYYILSFIDIVYIYLLNRKEEKKTLIKEEQQQIKNNLNKNDLLEYKNKLEKDFHYKGKKSKYKKIL